MALVREFAAKRILHDRKIALSQKAGSPREIPLGARFMFGKEADDAFKGAHYAFHSSGLRCTRCLCHHAPEAEPRACPRCGPGKAPSVVPRGEIRTIHPLGPLCHSCRPVARQAIPRSRGMDYESLAGTGL